MLLCNQNSVTTKRKKVVVDFLVGVLHAGPGKGGKQNNVLTLQSSSMLHHAHLQFCHAPLLNSQRPPPTVYVMLQGCSAAKTHGMWYTAMNRTNNVYRRKIFFD